MPGVLPSTSPGREDRIISKIYMGINMFQTLGYDLLVNSRSQIVGCNLNF